MISEKLNRVILSELGLDCFEISEETLASDIPGWDSLSHGRILFAIENEYGVEFTVSEILKLNNIGDLQALLDRKIQK